MTMNCVICNKKKITQDTTRSTSLLEEQCSVIYFLKTFLPSDKNNDLDLKHLLINHGNPSDWLHFCQNCTHFMSEGKKLHKLLVELQNQITCLKDKIITEITANFDSSSSSFEDITSLVRTKILQQESKLHKDEFSSRQDTDKNLEKDEESTKINIKLEVKPEEDELSLLDMIDEENEKVDDSFDNIMIYPEGNDNEVEDVEEFDGNDYELDGQEDLKLESIHSDDNDVKYNFNESTTTTETDLPYKIKQPGGRKKTPVETRRCNSCNIIFDRPSVLIRHMNSSFHDKEKIESVRGRLRPGGRRKTPVEDRRCTTCNIIFDRPSVLSKHMKTLLHQNRTFARSAATNKNNNHVYQERNAELIETRDDTSILSTTIITSSNQDLLVARIKSENGEYEESEKQKQSQTKKHSHHKATPGKSKSPVELRTCPFCNVIFDRPSFLTTHLSRNSTTCLRNDTVSCPVCSLEYNSRADFAKHYYSHTKLKPSHKGNKNLIHRSSYPECQEKIYPSVSKLQNHLKIKHNESVEEPIFSCTHCDKSFPSHPYLKSHEWQHLSQEEKINFLAKKKSKVSIQDKTCQECGLVFLTRSRMLFHRNSIHDKLALFTCEICKQGFTRKGGYEEHLKTHLDPEKREQLLAGHSVTVSIPSTQPNQEEERVTLKLKSVTKANAVSNRKCPTCNKIFSNRTRMNYHYKTVHKKSTRIICECGKILGSQNTFKRHMRYHNIQPGVKEFLCGEPGCGQQFRYSYSLRRHQILTHNPSSTDMERYPCPTHHCMKAFPFKSLLNQHQKSAKHFPSNQQIQDPSSTINQQQQQLSESHDFNCNMSPF